MIFEISFESQGQLLVFIGHVDFDDWSLGCWEVLASLFVYAFDFIAHLLAERYNFGDIFLEYHSPELLDLLGLGS